MNVLYPEDYVDRLAEVFPDISKESLLKIIKIGNSSTSRWLKTSESATISYSYKSYVTGRIYSYIMYKNRSTGLQNKFKSLKRYRDNVKKEQ